MFDAVVFGDLLGCLDFLIMLLSIENGKCLGIFFSVFVYGDSEGGRGINAAAK